jgi:hypothetical protein
MASLYLHAFLASYVPASPHVPSNHNISPVARFLSLAVYQLYSFIDAFTMAGDYRGDKVAEVAILFLALTWVTVSLRVYVRAIMTKSFGVDDWLAVLSLVCCTQHL